MLCAKLVPCATGTTNHYGDGELPPRHVEHLGRAVHDLVERQNREVERHHLHDGPQARHGCPNPQTGETQFGDGRVQHTHRPELFQHSFTDLVGPLVEAHFFTHQDDIL